MAVAPDASAGAPVTLPARWTPRQRRKNTAIYALVRALAAVLRCLPWRAVAPVAWVLGHVAWLLAGRERRRATEQLRWAMPQLQPSQVRQTVRGMFVHLARSLLEMAHLPRLLKDGPDAAAFSPAQRAIIEDTLAEGHGAIAVTGHIGNWELLAQALAYTGYKVHAIAKPLYDPRLTAWVDHERRAYGLNVLWRGNGNLGTRMLRVFRRGEMLALLLDQDTAVEGAFVPFFGRPAHTPTAAASLSLRLGAPILFFYTHRVGGKPTLHVERIVYSGQGEPAAQVVELTALLAQRLQQAIIMQPSQWVWLHARWKRQKTDGAPLVF